MRRLVVLDVVGLTPRVLAAAPKIAALASTGFRATLEPAFPAVTCPAQSTMLTGLLPREHGVVGNGWYHRDLAEILFWRQSNALVAGKKVWEIGRERDPAFTCATLFWWFNMYSSADVAVTPRPAYPADGRKLPDLWSSPPELRETLQRDLGPFPLFDFWGPRAGIASTRWIAEASKRVIDAHRPTLALVYLPHLDYDFQRFGPDDSRSLAAVREIDDVAADLAAHARAGGAEVIVLSEYGITPVAGDVALNRSLRRAGFLRVLDQIGFELLDAGASRAFAVADHQIAHVHVRDPRDLAAVRGLVESEPGVERVLDRGEQRALGVDHARSGELIAIAKPDHWFSYYYWLDEAKAPDFAPTVDIHRKPGYDPAELFLDPAIPLVKAKVAWTLAKKKLGFRTLLDVIPTSGGLVRGSHGRLPDRTDDGPVLLSSSPIAKRDRLHQSDVASLLLSTIFDRAT
jgi:predicted AlkP superfamily pyrophosphatase or phosphodiesterase